MKKLIILLLLSCSFTLTAQTTNVYEKVDEKIAQHSSSFGENAIAELVEFINSNFSNKTDKLRAVFTWITSNFAYDVENMFTIRFFSDTQEIIDEILKERKGVCTHFAYLFSEIANKLGIKTFVIAGYTKQNDVIDDLPHAWNASFINSAWYLTDPTWGAGFIQNQRFVRRQNNDYFKAKPTDLIRSHKPFDPLWQFLNFPISAQEFSDGRIEINKEKPFFNFADTLEVHKTLPRMEQLISANRRIRQNGVTSTLIRNHLQENTREIEHHRNQVAVDTFNSAVYLFNDGIHQLNGFILYRNRQFTPQKTETEIREMVKSAENSFISARNELHKILTTDTNLRNSINQLQISINEAIREVNEQNKFVDRYFNTRRIFRRSLFYKYTWMGIPLN